MSRYETVFILTPVLSDKQAKEAVDKYKALLKKSKAKIIHEENWGLRKLAYTIQKKSTGFYYLLEYEIDGNEILNFEVNLKRDEKIMRFLTVKMDKHHIDFAEKRRKKEPKKEEVAS